MATVLVVDDDEVGRLGREAAVARRGHRALAVTWAAAATGLAVAWPAVDLVLAVVRADPQHWDRYRGLSQVRALRASAGPEVRIASVLDSAGFANPMVRLRLHHAGAAEVFHRGQVATGEAIEAVADGRLVGQASQPRVEELAAVGVGRRSDPTRVVERILALGADEPAFLRAFDTAVPQNRSGVSRRRAHTLRVRVADLGDLLPDVVRSAGGPEKDTSLPRWPQMVAYVNLCRGCDPDDDRAPQPWSDEDHPDRGRAEPGLRCG